MLSTVPDFPLTIDILFRYGRSMFPNSRVVTYADGSAQERTFEQVASAADELALGLQSIGIGVGDRVGTLCWNTADHMAAYFAVPRLGAVLHTLNLRLSRDQLRYVIDHAGDRCILVDASLVTQLAEIAAELERVETFIVLGDADPAVFGDRGRHLNDVLAGASGQAVWPEIDERSAATLCYTSGTTGNPRGVAYGHRSTFLHTLASCSGNAFALSDEDRVLMMVPMFHANAWGLPYSGWMVGADLVLPGRALDALSLARIFAEQRPTFTAGVPTLFNDLDRLAQQTSLDMSCLRMAVCGGAAAPPSLIDSYRDRHGVSMLQGWGLTETGPLASLSRPPRGTSPDEETFWRTKSGRPVHGVEARVVAEDGTELPRDGQSVGELEVRGPWVTGSYVGEPTPEKFHDGWLRTGDVGHIDSLGYVQVTDRTKDVIKSGGEWISSVALENAIMGHHSVREAAVIAVPDERWDERPLAVVSLVDGAVTTPDEFAAFLRDKVVKWWIPERWTTVVSIPRTSVGKFDKRAIRDMHDRGRLEISRIEVD